MICLEFPPVNTTGNYRSAGFARYLAKHNVETHILTTDIKSGERIFRKNVDHRLMKGLESVHIHRFPIKPLAKFWKTKIGSFLRIWWQSTDNIDRRWFNYENKKEIENLIERCRPDILYLTLPPFSISRVAIHLSRKFNIPLVSDFRDAWSLWGTSTFSTEWHYKKVLKLERQLIMQSTKVLGVTQELIDDLKAYHEGQFEDKFRVVYNGYDKSFLTTVPTINIKHSDKISIGYVGSFYYQPTINPSWYRVDKHLLKWISYQPRLENWKYRSPYYFLKAVKAFVQSNPNYEAKLEFHLVGKKPSWLDEMLNEFRLQNNFVYHGFVDKSKVLELQKSWDILLATSENIVGGKHYCLPSKTFDYVESMKPIWAFITAGTQKEFYKDYPQVSIFNPDEDNSEKMLNAVSQIHSQKVEFKKLDCTYYRENQAKVFHKILKNVVSLSFILLFVIAQFQVQCKTQKESKIEVIYENMLLKGEYADIRDLGAKTNDIIDDSNAIHEAIDYAPIESDSSLINPCVIWDIHKGINVCNTKNSRNSACLYY